jgi:DNA-binding Lrp family transcriptional regulator
VTASERGNRQLDETDLALIDALHVNPRATAAQLGTALGLSPVTVSRRWSRLIDNGQAWVSSVPGPAMPVVAALFEAECVPGRTTEAAAALCRLPGVASLGLVTGSTDLYAFVVTGDPARLWQLLADVLPATPGLRSTRTGLMTALHSAPNWRLGAISSQQAATVRQQGDVADAARQLDDLDRAIYLALQDDGRATYRDLAAALGRSEQTINRRLVSMMTNGLIGFRCDFVRPQVGWRVQVMLRLQVPPTAVHQAARELASRPETRVCATVTGTANLVATVLLHQLDELDEVIRNLVTTWPGTTLVETHVILRSVKSWGRLLDDDGYAEAVVPVDLWA